MTEQPFEPRAPVPTDLREPASLLRVDWKQEAPQASHSLAPTSKPESQWTVAIDLKINYPEDWSYDGYKMGAQADSAHIKKLAKYTEGNPVTIVVQAVEPSTTDGKHMLERFAIKDGKIQSLDDNDRSSRGFTDDLTNLISLSEKLYPSKKIALVVNTHGAGNIGLFGDAGQSSLRQFATAIKSGLDGSAHTKFDVIDLMSCDMAQDGVLDQLSHVASQLVASPALEAVYGDKQEINGQKLDDFIQALIMQPNQSPNDFAELAITQAKQGVDRGDARHPGILTLSHFDLDKYPDFAKSLDRYGQTLARLVQNDGNRAAVGNIIQHLGAYDDRPHPLDGQPPPDTFKSSGPFQLRDLQSFIEAINRSIAEEDMNDPTGVLKRSGDDLLDKLGSLKVSYYGTTDWRGFDYENSMHGLSVYLPRPDSFDIDIDAINSSPLKSALQFCPDTKYSAAPGIGFATPYSSEDVARLLNGYPATSSRFHELDRHLAKAKKDLQPALSKPLDNSEFFKSNLYLSYARPICNDAQHLLHMPPFAKSYEQAKMQESKEMRQFVQDQMAPSVNGWQNFERVWTSQYLTEAETKPGTP